MEKAIEECGGGRLFIGAHQRAVGACASSLIYITSLKSTCTHKRADRGFRGGNENGEAWKERNRVIEWKRSRCLLYYCTDGRQFVLLIIRHHLSFVEYSTSCVCICCKRLLLTVVASIHLNHLT